MNKRELMQQKMQRQQAILTAARTAGRDMTEDEAREFNALQADIEELRPQVEAEAEADETVCRCRLHQAAFRRCERAFDHDGNKRMGRLDHA